MEQNAGYHREKVNGGCFSDAVFGGWGGDVQLYSD